MNKEKLLFLENKALQLRIDSIRATTAAGSGHPTSCMSAADLVSAIFFNFLKFEIKKTHNINNDRFILSKGHAIPVIYAAWKQLGVISDEQLLNLRKFSSPLEGHPTPRFEYNQAATGSLGQGLAIGVGIALNAKHEKLSYKTYVMMGDGEIAEGSVWEAAELAAHYKLDNLIGIVDCNKWGQSGESIQNHDVIKYAKQFEAFGCKTFVIDNGHNMTQILETIEKALNVKNQPTIIIAKTYKGYGLEEIQDKIGFHGKPFKAEELDKIISELKKKFKQAADFSCEQKYIPEIPAKNLSPEKHTTITLDISKDSNAVLFDLNKKIATRKAFGYALAALGKANKNIFALDGDVKNSTYTEFFEKDFPSRFIQCFIAEQSMVGISTGLEHQGKIPFAATFGAFFTRAHDQIRMAGIGRNALRLSGSHCGVSIGEDGPSQMALEDLSMMQAIPNSIVLYPADGVSTYKLTELMANYFGGISYIRTTRAETPNLYDKNEKFEIGGCKILKESNKDRACIIGAGITVHEALKAYEQLKNKNIFVSVIDLYSIKPLDEKTITQVAKNSGGKIITVEDHYPQGGLGQTVASALLKEKFDISILAVNQIPRSGTPEELMAFCEIDAKAIIKKVMEIV
jgi:transketolase